MTRAVLEHGHSLGYRIGALQSPDQGFPVYQRMGFFEVCESTSLSATPEVPGACPPALMV